MSIKNGSKLEQIEQFLQEIVGKQLALELKLTTRIDKGTLKYVKDNPFLQNCTSKTKDKPLGCLVYCEKFSNEYESVTIGQWIKWRDNIPELSARWSTLYDFFVEVNTCGQELQDKAIAKIQEESKNKRVFISLIISSSCCGILIDASIQVVLLCSVGFGCISLGYICKMERQDRQDYNYIKRQINMDTSLVLFTSFVAL